MLTTTWSLETAYIENSIKRQRKKLKDFIRKNALERASVFFYEAINHSGELWSKTF